MLMSGIELVVRFSGKYNLIHNEINPDRGLDIILDNKLT